ncbi:hypothetical protein CC2G_006155 [Coprinopsis cinerea AmutBmut pab1-1]|nr:hypothetical protein CC2G_006155 [Coprinopsis cinerea AmutBmut pab1-1]
MKFNAVDVVDSDKRKLYLLGAYFYQKRIRISVDNYQSPLRDGPLDKLEMAPGLHQGVYNKHMPSLLYVRLCKTLQKTPKRSTLLPHGQKDLRILVSLASVLTSCQPMPWKCSSPYTIYDAARSFSRSYEALCVHLDRIVEFQTLA